MTANTSLLQLIEDRIASGKVELPPANHITAKLHEVTSNPDFNMNEVVELIGSDPALTTEILRLANGTFYGGLSEIKTVRDATVRLGAPEVVRLAALMVEKALYKVRHPELAKLIPDLWHHAMATAMGAKWLAVKLGFADLENEAFIGGLLHDVGTLLLVRILDDILAEDETHVNLEQQLLLELLDLGHTKEGYALVKHWNLPEEYCEVVRDHHNQDLTRSGTLINLVALADKACQRHGIGLEHDESLRLESTEEAHTLGAGDIVLAQLLIMLEDAYELV